MDQTPSITPASVPPSQDHIDDTPIDFPSIQGKFGWTKVMSVNMPFIYRQSERFASVRIYEMYVLQKSHLNVAPAVFEYCFQGTMQAFTMTPAECRLFDEINSTHCNGIYGRNFDCTTDHIFRISDAILLSKFIMMCYSLSKGINSLDKIAGFVRIQDDIVPYVHSLLGGVKYVPTFCFDDTSGFIKSKKITMSGYHVAYLKLCCYILGIRQDLVRGKSISVVDLNVLRPYLPDEPFPDVWPIEDIVRKLEVIGPKCASMKWIVHSSLNPNSNKSELQNFGPKPVTLFAQELKIINFDLANKQSFTVRIQTLNNNELEVVNLPEVDVATVAEPYHLQVFPKKFNGKSVSCINMFALEFSRDVSGYLIYLCELNRKVFKSTSVEVLAQAMIKYCDLYKANKAQMECLSRKGLVKDRMRIGWDLLVTAKDLDESMDKINQILQKK